MAKTAIEVPVGATLIRERRPFLRLTPKPMRGQLPPPVVDGLRHLEAFIGDEALRLVRLLVDFTLAAPRRDDPFARLQPPSVSVLNRRRRAARIWLHTILSGEVDQQGLHALTHSLLPQLVGTGPDVHRAAGLARETFEFLRGAITALILGEPQDNLVPAAKALFAMEAVLAVHLAAFERAVAHSLEAAARV